MFGISFDLPPETGVVISCERIAEDLREDKIRRVNQRVTSKTNCSNVFLLENLNLKLMAPVAERRIKFH